jgi:phytoene dehydrogenase-like protein
VSPVEDALVIGSGPNGLAAAITLARAGRQVLVREAEDTLGGGLRSGEITLPGFIHDICSAIHPFVPASPFFRQLQLAQHGLDLVDPPAALAHPFDDGTAVVVERSLDATAAALGPDGEAYRSLLRPVSESWEDLSGGVLGPLVRIPPHPLVMARFGMRGVLPAATLARRAFTTERARALFAGCAAHSIVPLERLTTAAFGLLLLATAHRFGWPFPRGGSQRVADALLAVLRGYGGEVVAAEPVESLEEVDARMVLCDVAPRELIRIAGSRLPPRYSRRLAAFPHGPGAFKVDFALDGPIPWRAEACAQAATIHLGGTLAEIAESERAPWEGRPAERPFVLLAQPSLFDTSRAPKGKHTAWAYCHVPNGSSFDMTERIEEQIERFAPGFRDLVIGRSVLTPSDLERHDRNYVGGDINGGAATFRGLLARPTISRSPYRTPAEGVYLCSASTPPGGGVHGMCGYWAARAALSDAL